MEDLRKVLGLDIGIASVGWGLLEQDSGDIIDAGVRLFEEAGRNANEERRSFRGSRRLKRRKSHRLERAKDLFTEYNLPISGIGKFNPYQARYNAIYESVTKEELVAGLYHLVKMRGTTLDSPEDEDGGDNELSTKQQIAKNRKLLTDQFVCEVQLQRQEDGERIRNHQNRFRTTDYVQEANAILNNQRDNYHELNDDFNSSLLKLIETRREYYEGPGSEKSPTPYGRFFINEQGEVEEESMINKMRGRCTYFPDELRIAKMSVTADLFNLLSGDLNKLQLEGEYLNNEDKLYLYNNFIKKGKNITLHQILKHKKLAKDADVTGYRVDLKGDKALFTEFKGYKEIKKIVEKNNLPTDILEDMNLMDGIAEVLTAEKAYHRREEQLHELLTAYDPAERKKIVDAFKESTVFTGYHALSKKAMTLVMNDLWHTNQNQMELFSALGLEEKRLENVKNKSNIPFDDTAILSTVAKRAHREAIKIVNAVRSKHGNLDAIVVETAKEKNSEEKRKQYQNFQKQVGKHEKEMAKLLGVKSLAELKLNGKQHLALKLLKQQDWKSIYSGKAITPQDVVQDRLSFEIDHIIPVSISFDDSQSNKVICLQGENQDKGQRTPFEYFQTQKRPRSFDAFKSDVLNLSKSRGINRKKKDYLLEMRDVKYNDELQKEFINRNLIDTQYAMRSFSMNLRTFFKVNEIDTTVLSIRGSFTAALRRRARLNKDRDESHAHHAIDALIVAAVGKMSIFDFFTEFDMNETGAVVNRETGEILEEEEMFNSRFTNFLRRLRNYESEVKYSHKVDRKANRSLSNQTIYGTRKKDGEKYTIGKYKDFYSLDKNQVKPLLKKLDKKPEDFFIAKYNPDVMDLVLKIMKEYKNEPNPFYAYYQSHGYILKDGKVPVKTLKYYDKRLGVHMDISDNYPGAKNEIVLKSIKSVRIDIYKNNEGKYKYLGLPYHWFRQKGNRYILDMEKYEEEKAQKYKKIDDSFEFQFSLYQNDLFAFEKKEEEFDRVFRGDNNPKLNVIEVDYPWKKKEEQKEGFLSPSTISNVMKYNVDVLGNTYKVTKEIFKNYLQL